MNAEQARQMQADIMNGDYHDPKIKSLLKKVEKAIKKAVTNNLNHTVVWALHHPMSFTMVKTMRELEDRGFKARVYKSERCPFTELTVSW